MQTPSCAEHNILGRHDNCQTMEIRRKAAERELVDGAWMNVFNALRFDGLVPNNDQAATFFADWAAQNHLHLGWQTQFVPQQTLLEAMKAELSPFTEEAVTLISFIPQHFQKGNGSWMHKRTQHIP